MLFKYNVIELKCAENEYPQSTVSRDKEVATLCSPAKDIFCLFYSKHTQYPARSAMS